MAYRTFTDSTGLEWHAWDVKPQALERRTTERRQGVRRIEFVDRRHGSDRRVTAGQWTILRSGLARGWLCFDAEAERRRLTPIPADWDRCSLDELEAYCRSASPVRRVGLRVTGG